MPIPESDLEDTERALIRVLKPKYNRQFNDGSELTEADKASLSRIGFVSDG